MIKTIFSIGFAIIGGLVLLKLVGILFSIVWFAMKLGLVLIFAIPLFFIIRGMLSKSKFFN
jgi:surface polysaccharide O-acyltransferase-like enzyme